MICSSIACNLDQQVLSAALPLFESGKVEAIEWSFDTLYKKRDIPTWFVDLLQFYGKNQRLIGHGVYYSLFSGRWTSDQQAWLDDLQRKAQHFHFDHVTEHFGFMTGADFHVGAPMSIPFTPTTLRIGQDRLKRMEEACQCKVGVENLAFSYSLNEVKQHGDFLRELVEPVHGFIILDLHNLYCQAKNFGLQPENLLDLYPLELVREIHISGGSWENSGIQPVRTIRRDTHDDAVPEEVFDLLKSAIPKCTYLQFVVLEQLGTGLMTPASQKQFQDDFIHMDSIVKEMDPHLFILEDYFPPLGLSKTDPAEDEALHQQQIALTNILENAADFPDAQHLLKESTLANSDWKIENWDPYMIETAMQIAQKWKGGF